jgi:hypothetical protein
MPNDPLTPSQRSIRARIAAHTLHSTVDSRAHTRPARKAFLERFENEVDPERTLPEPERRRRAESAKTAYFTRLAYRSAIARSSRKGDRAVPPGGTGSEHSGGDSCGPDAVTELSGQQDGLAARIQRQLGSGQSRIGREELAQ